MKKTMFVLCFIFLTFMAITALAQEGDRHEENGFSARIEAGAIWINTTDRLFVVLCIYYCLCNINHVGIQQYST